MPIKIKVHAKYLPLFVWKCVFLLTELLMQRKCTAPQSTRAVPHRDIRVCTQ